MNTVKEFASNALWIAAGVGILAWLLVYQKQASALVTTGATSYGTLVRALEPPSIGGSGGFSPSTIMPQG